MSTVENTNENTNKENNEKKVFNNRGSRPFNNDFRKPFNRNNKNFERKRVDFTILNIRKVSRTMAGGRRMGFSVLLVVAIGNGVIGIGQSKCNEVSDAIQNAIKKAEKNPIKIALHENRTFAHSSLGKHGATKIMFLPRRKEQGLRALGVARKLAKIAGIKDGVVKILTKASSKNNICHAFTNACNNMTYKTKKGVEYERTSN